MPARPIDPLRPTARNDAEPRSMGRAADPIQSEPRPDLLKRAEDWLEFLLMMARAAASEEQAAQLAEAASYAAAAVASLRGDQLGESWFGPR